MQLMLKKMDTIIDLKMDILVKEFESKQDRFEQQMTKKVMELKREFRDISQRRDSFYKQTLSLSKKKEIEPVTN